MNIPKLSVRWDGIIIPLTLMALSAPAGAKGTPAGTVLTVVAQVDYTDSKALTVHSPASTVTVAANPDIAVSLSRKSDTVGGATAYACTLTNRGNLVDSIRISLGTSSNTYALLVNDDNADGAWQTNETVSVALKSNVAPDESAQCLLVVQPISGTTAGSKGTVTVDAVSNYDKVTKGTAAFTATYVKKFSPSFVFNAGESLPSSPVIVDGAAIVGSETGTIFAVSTVGTSAGKLKWRYPVEGNLGAAVRGRVAFDDDGFYFTANNGMAYKLDRTGQYVWRSQIVPPGTEMEAMPLLSGDEITLACGDGRVRRIDKHSGALLGESGAVGGGALTTPSMPGTGDMWVGGADGQLYNIQNGPEFTVMSARQMSEQPITATPFVDSRSGLVLTATPEGKAYALKSHSSEVKWGPVSLGSPVKGSPWVDSQAGIAYFAGTDNTIHALRVADGAKVAGYPIRLEDTGGFVNSLVLDPMPGGSSVLFAASTSGRVYGFRPSDPTRMVQYDAGDPFVSFVGSPALSDSSASGILVASGTNGKLYGFAAANAVAP